MEEYPQVGRKFVLTCNNIQPLELVRESGYDVHDWKYVGKRITGLVTRKFWLIDVDFCEDWGLLTQKLREYGEIPEGQWLMAFRSQYSKTDDKGPIGVADNSWIDPDEDKRFPFISRRGNLSFRHTEGCFGDGWRWLITA